MSGLHHCYDENIIILSRYSSTWCCDSFIDKATGGVGVLFPVESSEAVTSGHVQSGPEENVLT